MFNICLNMDLIINIFGELMPHSRVADSTIKGFIYQYNKTILEINVKNSKKVKNWEKENKKAIDSYNQRIKENGLFSDGLRQF